MKVKRLTLIIILVVVILFLLLSLVLISKNRNDEKTKDEAVVIETDESLNKKVNESVNDGIREELEGLSEQKRVEYYATKFIKALEARNVSLAYSMLNEDFKTNYFNKQDAFGEYIKKYFPKETSIEYKNMERLGDIYVLVVDVKDILSSDPNDFECYIVVKENDYNDFELSFSVDSAMKKYYEDIEE